MEENNQTFTSPVRKYITERLQVPFDFAKEIIIPTFETPKARYEVRVAEWYLTLEEAAKDGHVLDKSRPLKLEPKSGSSKPKPTDLFFSSSWFEVYNISNEELDDDVENEQVYQGNLQETAAFLLELDGEREHFSYCQLNWFSEPDIFEGHAQVDRSLQPGERESLDALIKQKLDVLYRT